jgi:hypothetical protein
MTVAASLKGVSSVQEALDEALALVAVAVGGLLRRGQPGLFAARACLDVQDLLEDAGATPSEEPATAGMDPEEALGRAVVLLDGIAQSRRPLLLAAAHAALQGVIAGAGGPV